MQALLNSEFSASNLTGIVEAVSSSGAGIAFVLKSPSGFTRTRKGYMAVIFPGGGARLVDMLLAIEPEYQSPEALETIRVAVFDALAIPIGTSWRMQVALSCAIEFLSEHIEDGHLEL